MQYKTSELSCETWLKVAIALPVIIVISAAIGLVFYIHLWWSVVYKDVMVVEEWRGEVRNALTIYN